MSIGNFVDDKEAFLFTTERNGLKINVNTVGSNAFYDASHYGPTFGNAHDLHVADQSDQHNSSYTKVGTAYVLPQNMSATNDSASILQGAI